MQKERKKLDVEQIPQDPNFDRKLDLITAGARPHIREHLLTRITTVNCKTIIAYILALQAENNPSQGYRIDIISKLKQLAEFHHPKSFHDMTREDIIEFLDRLRKPESVDPLHHWQGSYANNLAIIKPFFIWLGFPSVVENLRPPKRKEISTYKPSELWTPEDDLLFCKYCPSKRDRAYHMVARDTGMRPGGLLDLRIKDIHWKNTDSFQVAEITVRDKTGVHTAPIINGIPWLKDWLSNGHPFPTVETAAVFCGEGKKNTGRPLSKGAINAVYRLYKHEIFPELLKNKLVEPEDIPKVEEMLRVRRWNPYTRKHTAITEKSKILPRPLLNQFAGWTPNSNMSAKYIHYFNNEATNKLYEAAGIKVLGAGGEQQLNNSANKLKPKVCYNCSTANRPDAKICSNDKCRYVLDYDHWMDREKEHEQTKKEMEELKMHQENMQKTMGSMMRVILGQSDTIQVHMSEELMDEESIKFMREMSQNSTTNSRSKKSSKLK
jgi:integrase